MSNTSEALDVARLTGKVLVLHPCINGKRVSLSDWLRAAKSKHGPLPRDLRHVLVTIASHMRGNGENGCFPSNRTLAEEIGCAHTTIGRAVRELIRLGWLEAEKVPRQWGREGSWYFATVPEAMLPIIGALKDAPIRRGNGAPSTLQSAPRRKPNQHNGARSDFIGAREPIIGAPRGVPESHTESQTEGAAPRARAEARSAAQTVTEVFTSRDVEMVRDLYLVKKYHAEEIVRFMKPRGVSADCVLNEVIRLAKHISGNR